MKAVSTKNLQIHESQHVKLKDLMSLSFRGMNQVSFDEIERVCPPFKELDGSLSISRLFETCTRNLFTISKCGYSFVRHCFDPNPGSS